MYQCLKQPRGLLLFLLGARQRHGHRAGWLRLAIRNALGAERARVTRFPCLLQQKLQSARGLRRRHCSAHRRGA